jgi:argininosuccinate lyase
MNEKPKSGEAQRHSLWGGRFAAAPDALMETVNASIGFDKAMAAQDLAGSRAHSSMLAETGIISADDDRAIQKGLDDIEAELGRGDFVFKPALEDIHMHVEARLAELIGDAAGRLHTARSRNDQVATDLRLWIRDAIDGLDGAFHDLQTVVVNIAGDHVETILPGMTHLQPAQPVTLGHHLLAYYEMFARDRGRLHDCRARLNESPLGAAALAGTPFPIDRESTAAALGFDQPMANSMDAVSARDFVLEFLAAAAIAATHLSRLGEEIVLWASPAYGFVQLPDTFSTGSSIMPQKRNPDAAELVRAKAGRIVGALTGLLVVLKGLPLAYSKDMQEDKEPAFDAAEQLHLCVSVMAGMLRGLQFDAGRMRAAANQGFLTATDLADWLVQSLGIPFRKAHRITGEAVRMAEERGCGLAELPPADLKGLEPGITDDVFEALRVETSVARRASQGGTAPARVREALARAREQLG